VLRECALLCYHGMQYYTKSTIFSPCSPKTLPSTARWLSHCVSRSYAVVLTAPECLTARRTTEYNSAASRGLKLHMVPAGTVSYCADRMTADGGIHDTDDEDDEDEGKTMKR